MHLLALERQVSLLFNNPLIPQNACFFIDLIFFSLFGCAYGLELQQIAYEYAIRRANLMLVARREHRLRGIAENARRMGARHVMIMAADVVKEDDCRRFVNETINVFGRGMFCCACAFMALIKVLLAPLIIIVS